jgi:hypothetical protein
MARVPAYGEDADSHAYGKKLDQGMVQQVVGAA